MYVADSANAAIRRVTAAGLVTTLAGRAVTGNANGFGPLATFSTPYGVAVLADGRVVASDYSNYNLRIAVCVPVLCTAGAYCPLGSVTATANPPGFFSTAGAASPTPCAGGTFTAATGSTACQRCPAGHYCPTGSSMWRDKNCGRGNYCPWNSSAPTSCGPKGAVDPVLGPANGPAFLSDVAACRAHCFNGAPGQLSTCAGVV